MNSTKDQIKEWVESRSERIAKHIEIRGNQDIHYSVGEMVVQCIQDLALKSKWVSVDDELPNDGEEVLMYMNDGAVMSDIKCHSGRYSNKYGFERSRVTHWMPLPEPPK
jgi:hypothetical protein